MEEFVFKCLVPLVVQFNWCYARICLHGKNGSMFNWCFAGSGSSIPVILQCSNEFLFCFVTFSCRQFQNAKSYFNTTCTLAFYWKYGLIDVVFLMLIWWFCHNSCQDPTQYFCQAAWLCSSEKCLLCVWCSLLNLTIVHFQNQLLQSQQVLIKNPQKWWKIPLHMNTFMRVFVLSYQLSGRRFLHSQPASQISTWLAANIFSGCWMVAYASTNCIFYILPIQYFTDCGKRRPSVMSQSMVYPY